VVWPSALLNSALGSIAGNLAEDAVAVLTALLAVSVHSAKATGVVAGAAVGFIALMTYSAILAATCLPLLVLYYAVGNRQARGPERPRRAAGEAATTAGFLLTTLIMQAAYRTYGQGFFFANNIKMLLDFTVGDLYRAPAFEDWVFFASWLMVPLSIAIAAAILLLARRRAGPRHPWDGTDAMLLLAPVAFSGSLLINVVLRQWSLQPLYFNLTLPAYFLSLAGILFVTVKTRRGLAACTAAFLALGIVVLVATRRANFTFADFSTPVLTFMGRAQPFTVGEPVNVMGVGILVVGPIALAGELSAMDPGRTSKLWYSRQDEMGPLFMQANAAAYLSDSSQRVSKSFPSMSNEGELVGSGGTLPRPGDTLILMSGEPNADAAAVASLADAGLRAHVTEVRRVPLEGGTAYLTALSLSR
jgi:hypothetical protein